MRTLHNIKELQSFLFNYLNSEYFRKSKANYLYITKMECTYDDITGDVYCVDIHITWGRYYKDEEKAYLNESHKYIIPINIEYLENYDFILGKFVSELDGDRYEQNN